MTQRQKCLTAARLHDLQVAEAHSDETFMALCLLMVALCLLPPFIVHFEQRECLHISIHFIIIIQWQGCTCRPRLAWCAKIATSSVQMHHVEYKAQDWHGAPDLPLAFLAAHNMH